ncbi:MAG: hypothetical protein JST90_04330 [Bacteroidetes bacterium]|nr:hypothetical protein [Bacteroidota bacterium]
MQTIFSKFIAPFSLLLGILIAIVWGQSHEARKYFKDFHLRLEGHVTGKEIDSHQGGMLYVDVTHSSLPYYDPRDSMSGYYCVIHGDKAEILQRGIGDIADGDSLSISTDEDRFQVFRDHKLIQTSRVSRPDFLPSIRGNADMHRLPPPHF